LALIAWQQLQKWQAIAFKPALCTISNYDDPFDNLIKSSGCP
jgi:hypothetical protein